MKKLYVAPLIANNDECFVLDTIAETYNIAEQIFTNEVDNEYGDDYTLGDIREITRSFSEDEEKYTILLKRNVVERLLI